MSLHPTDQQRSEHEAADVTQHNRITGQSRRSQPVVYERTSTIGNIDWGAVFASVFAGMGVTLLLLAFGMAAGLEAGDSGAEASTVAQGIGWWAVVSALVGTFVGCFIGGRFARMLRRASAVYHGVTSWGLATVLTLVLAALGTVGVLGSALQASADVAGDGGATAGQAAPGAGAAAGTGNAAGNGAAANGARPNGGGAAGQAQGNAQGGDAQRQAQAPAAAETATDAASTGSWVLALGLLGTLAAAIAGWILGARQKLLGVERERDARIQRA